MVMVKNEDVLTMLTALSDLSREKLPVKGALKVRKLHRTLKQAWDDVESVRKQLFEEFAEHDEQGDLVFSNEVTREVKLKDGAIEAFNAAWDELMAHTVEVPEALAVEDIGTAEIRPHILIGLGDLLAE